MKYLCAALLAALALSGHASAMRNETGQYIVNSLSGKCIDVSGAPGTSNGARLQLWDCEYSGQNNDNGSDTDQRWFLTSEGFIVNELSGKCIDVSGAPGTSNGAKLDLWDCETGRGRSTPTDQQWDVTRKGQIRNRLSGKCLDVAGAPGTKNGAQLDLYDCESPKNSDQYWQFEN